MAKRTATKQGPDSRMSLGRVIALLRTTRGWSQSDLARTSGVKRASISEYEADITTPDATTVERLLAAMELRWSALDLGQWFLERLAAESSSGAGISQPTAREAAAEVSDLAAKLSRLAVALREEGGNEARPEAEPLRNSRRSPKSRPRPVEGGQAASLGKPTRSCSARRRLKPCGPSASSCARKASGSAPTDRNGRLHRGTRSALADGAGDEGLLRSKLRGFAWAHVGNALRAKGDLLGAERVFRLRQRDRGRRRKSPRASWKRGWSSPSRHLSGGRNGALMKRDDSLSALPASTRSRKFAAQIVVSGRSFFEERGLLEDAVALLQGVDEASVEGDGRLLLCVKHNLADNLSKLGRCREAEALLPDARAFSSRVGGELDRVRLMWTEGRVAAGLDSVDEGIATLTRVPRRIRFSGHGLRHRARFSGTCQLLRGSRSHGRGQELGPAYGAHLPVPGDPPRGARRIGALPAHRREGRSYSRVPPAACDVPAEGAA